MAVETKAETVYVKVKRNDLSDGKIDYDVIQVSCDYMQGRGVVISAYVGESGAFGHSINITQGERAICETMTRLNRKRLAELQAKFRADTLMRLGQPWALVERLCHTFDLTPEPEAE